MRRVAECRAWGSQCRDRGVTMVELAITVLLLGVLTAAVAGLTIAARTSNAETVSRLDQVNAARTAVEGVSRTVRASVKQGQIITCTTCATDAFVIGQDFQVRFYANIDNPSNSVGPSLVTYSVATSGPDTGNLIEKILIPDSNHPDPATGYAYCNPDGASPSVDCLSRQKRRILATGVVTSPGKPVFRYFDPTGIPLVPTGSLTAGQLSKVLSIEVQVTVQSTRATKPRTTTYIQRMLLPNAKSVIQQDTP